MVNKNHYNLSQTLLSCLVCLTCSFSRACIGGIYCLRHKKYVQYQRIEKCEELSA